MNSHKKILIIGSGQAAIYAASEFRKHDKDSTVTIFGNENYHPYERPPLSKEFLMNKKKEDEFLFFSKNCFDDQNVSFINKKIDSVDFKNKYLISQLRKLNHQLKISLIDDYGLNGDLVESQMFGYIGIRSLKKLILSTPNTTGVKKNTTGGNLYC